MVIFMLIAADATQTQSKMVKHSIQNGETLYIIARANHTTIAEVRKINGLKKGELLKIGRVLTVPVNTYFPEKRNKKLLASIKVSNA